MPLGVAMVLRLLTSKKIVGLSPGGSEGGSMIVGVAEKQFP